MKKVERTVFISNYGREFLNEEECRRHETRRELTEYVEPKVSRYDLSVEEVLEALLDKYTIIPRTTYMLYLGAIVSMRDLINDSTGVAGIHLNGDVASWDSLRRGGQFEEWLGAFDDLLDATNTPEA